MINESIFETLKPTAYASARSQIQNGDIMLCSGDGFIAPADIARAAGVNAVLQLGVQIS